ncbi:MAG: amidohydrolase family protein [Rhodobiaceae bacterium]|nr:amidohydrolase family protein [Rhodobiaceae bacterium]
MENGNSPKPAFAAPPLTCDTHFHVFGPTDRYPAASTARYEPPHAPLDDYLAHAAALGVERMVVVQPSGYGRDNRCTLDTLDALGARARAIVDIDETVSDAELADLHARGVRGVRVNVSPVEPFDASLPDALLPRIDMLEAKLAGMGWVIEVLAPGWLTEALLPRLQRLRVDFVLCHLGMFLAAEGPSGAGFSGLLKLLDTNPRCWIKLTAVYRFATAPDFADAAPMVEALVRTAPDRLIWGTDYPHLSFAESADTVALFNLLADWLPTQALKQQVLVDNPARLFGFGQT